MIATKLFSIDLISKVMKKSYLDIYNDIYFKSGDVYSSYTISPGFITNSGKELDFYITLPKSLKNITTITLNTLSGDTRGKMYYIGASAYSGSTNMMSGATVTIEKTSDYSIRLVLVKSSAYTNGSTVNNSGIVFNGNIKLTLA